MSGVYMFVYIHVHVYIDLMHVHALQDYKAFKLLFNHNWNKLVKCV